MVAEVRVEDAAGGVAVVAVLTPLDVEELDRQWSACMGFIPTWEDQSAEPLLEALRPLMTSEGGGVVVDLMAMKRGSVAVAAVVSEAWLELSERGRGMALVATEDLAFALSMRGLQAKCPVVTSRADAVSLAAAVPAALPLDQRTVAGLGAIEQQLRTLIHERIGHLYGGEPPCPSVAKLVKAGVTSGGVAFPYGGLAWRVTGAGDDLRLEYDDHARIAGGWGRRYLISASSTTLVEEGLD